MPLSSSLQGFHSYAQYALSEGIKTGLFKVPTLFAAIASKQTTSGRMGEPGQAAVIGKPMSVAKRKSIGGSTQRHIAFQTSRVGGGKYLSEDGTTSSTGTARSDKVKRTTAISWSFYEQPIAIRNMSIRMAGDKYAIGSAIEDSVTFAMNETVEKLAGDAWHGSPSDDAADVYDDLVGVMEWIDDNNVIGTIDRSSVSGFNGVRDDAGVSVSLSEIDNASLADSNGLAIYGSKRDLAITTPSVYKKLKQEALAAGGQLVTSSMTSGQSVGFKDEYINYCNTMITFDPYATNAAGSEANFLIADTSTWCLEVHSGENFRVLPFKNLGDDAQPGSSDVTVSKIRAGLRWICEEPWKNKLYTNVS